MNYCTAEHLRGLDHPEDLLRAVSYKAGHQLAQAIWIGDRHRGEVVEFFNQHNVAERPSCEFFEIETADSGLSIAMYGARDWLSDTIQFRFQVAFRFVDRYEPVYDPYRDIPFEFRRHRRGPVMPWD